MQQGVDYDRAYSPTIQRTSRMTLVALAALVGAELFQGDVPQAYLNAPSKVVKYAFPPPCARQRDDMGRRIVWEIYNALYGDPPSGRDWYDFMRALLT